VEGIHGIPLQTADLDGLLIVSVQHARALAEHFHGADARAACTEHVGFEDRPRRPRQIVAGDLLDEARHVDVRGAGLHAGRVKAVETAVGFDDGGGRGKRRMQVGKARCDLRRRGRLCDEVGWFAHGSEWVSLLRVWLW
jgi:hypothetical protein